MRISSYILIALGILLFVKAGIEEYRGNTNFPSPHRYSGYSRFQVTKQADPEQFRNVMTYHWLYASMLTVVGVIANVIDRGQEKSDPMSPDSDENIDQELQQDESDERTKNEQK